MQPLTSTMLAALAAIVLLVPVAAQAALPPFWQSAKEITAIVNDERVHDALRYEEPILSVAARAADTYEIKTERCTVQVKIVDKPVQPGIMGPRQFDLDVGEATCQ